MTDSRVTAYAPPSGPGGGGGPDGAIGNTSSTPSSDPSSQVRRVLIVGASLAGTRTAEALLSAGYDGEIVIAGEEPHRPYDRPPLSKGYLTGDVLDEHLHLDAGLPAGRLDAVVDHHRGDRPVDTAEARLRWRLGSAATRLDPTARTVEFADGGLERYDRLVIACGTTPIVPPSLDASLDGVHLMRTLDDSRGLREQLESGATRVAVIGAGFIGAELASTCRARGLPTTLIDLAPLPLSRPLGPAVAARLMEMHERAGTHFKLGVYAEGLTSTTRAGRARVTGVTCSDGTHVEADCVVIAIGVRPATDWLDGSGVAVRDGVVCNADLCSVSHPDVLAVGDVARWDHPLVGESVRVEHWSNAAEGAHVVAATIMGVEARHASVPSFWSDQLGVKIQGVGLTAYADEVEVDESGEALFATYRREGQVIGGVSFGKPRRLIPVRRELSARLVPAS